MRITLAQSIIIPGKPANNLLNALPMISQASDDTSDLILFPELWTSGYDLQGKDIAIIARENQECMPELIKISREKRITIAGSMILREGSNFYNAFTIIYPDGSEPLTYQKIHLFRLMYEDRWFSPGSKLVTGQIANAKIGLATCYDLRFPVMFTRLMEKGVSLILLCAEWPTSRIDQWLTLLTARAMENQLFVAAVNTVGILGNEMFGGCSTVIDPMGYPLVMASNNKQEIFHVEIELEQVDVVREEFPTITERRPDIYG